MSLCHSKKKDLNKNASGVSKPETEAHALSLWPELPGSTKEAVEHAGATGANMAKPFMCYC